MNYKVWLVAACIGMIPGWQSFAVDMPAETGHSSVTTLATAEQEELVLQSYARVWGKISAMLSKDRIVVDDRQGPYVILTRSAKVLDLATGEWVKNHSFQVGEEVVAFIRRDTPQTMSMPPQTNAQVIAIHPGTKYSVDMDYYNAAGEGMSHRLIVRNWPTTAEDTAGHAVKSSVAGQKLILYTISTRSLPPQTNPEKVIIWQDHPLNSPSMPWREEEKQVLPAEPNDTAIGAGQDVPQWLPLRDYFTDKGIAVTWDNELRAVILQQGAQKVTLYVDKEMILHENTQVVIKENVRLQEGATYITKEVAEMIEMQLNE